MMTDDMQSSCLKEKVALVVGSTGGVGLRVAEALRDRGASVALNGRGEEAGRDALSRFSGAGGADAIFEPGSASNYGEITRVVRAVEARLGRIDILVCSGGTDTPGPTLFHELPPDLFVRAYEARFLSKMFPVHAALPGMRERGSGSIVLLTTDGARHVTPGQSLNGSVGAATIFATKALGLELARYRIRVNALALTLTADTPHFAERLGGDDLASKVFSKALARFPFGAPPTATDVARTAAFLASDDACQITGQTISVNGGLSFGGW